MALRMTVVAARRARPAVATTLPQALCARGLAVYKGNDGYTNVSLIDYAGPTPSVDPDDAYIGGNIFIRWYYGIKLYGLRKTLVQCYTMGNIKFGRLVGADHNGNHYYENEHYPYGQHRWVEYRDVHNYDGSSVAPEWHGWLHHQNDVPGPDSRAYVEWHAAAADQVEGDNAIYKDNLGRSEYEGEELTNWTSFRKRGYNIGGIKQKPGQKDRFRVHAGHAINKKGPGRYDPFAGVHEWTPDGEPPKDYYKDLDQGN